MIFYKLCACLSLIVLASVVLIYADTNGNVINPLSGQMNGSPNLNMNNNLNLVEEDSMAECTRCSEPRLIGCMRGKCYYRCYRRCTLGNMTYDEALRFTLPGH